MVAAAPSGCLRQMAESPALHLSLASEITKLLLLEWTLNPALFPFECIPFWIPVRNCGIMTFRPGSPFRGLRLLPMARSFSGLPRLRFIVLLSLAGSYLAQ